MKWLYVFVYLLWIGDLVLFIWVLNHYSLFSDEFSLWESFKGLFWTLCGCVVITGAAIGLTTYIAALVAAVAAKKAAKAAGKAIDAAIDYICEVVLSVIDVFTVKDVVRKKVPQALKAEILEKKKNALSVGIFSNETDISYNMTLTSDEGVSDDIYIGQVIYL